MHVSSLIPMFNKAFNVWLHIIYCLIFFFCFV